MEDNYENLFKNEILDNLSTTKFRRQLKYNRDDRVNFNLLLELTYG